MSVQTAQASATALERVRGLVDALLARKGLAPAGEEQDLRAAGLSSLDTVNLMLAVEGEFDLFVPQADMTPQSFRSIGAISRLVERLA